MLYFPTDAAPQFLKKLTPFICETVRFIWFLQGAVYHKLGNLVMAEKVLREAINIDPTAFEAW